MATSEPEVRQQIREIADGALIEALVSFVAAIQERDISGAEHGTAVLEEWSSALVELTQTARECLETYRTLGEIPPRDPLDALLDERASELITQRRRALRAANEEIETEVECMICNGPCQGH